MREIKFRAWDDEEEIMIWPENYRMSLYARINDDGSLHGDVYADSTRDEDIIFMQYTGLKDKNGVEIYEGDIVRHQTGAIGSVFFGKYITDNEDNEDIVGWTVELALRCRALDPQGSWEVIGNIYENPELLK